MAAPPSAQPPAPIDPGVRDLLVLLDAGDESSVRDAARALVRIGPPVTPALVEILRTRRGCQVQWAASGVLLDLGVEPQAVETARLAVARGACDVRSPRDYATMQAALDAVADRPGGVRLLAGLLRGRDPIGRARAIVTFAALTARLEAGHPDPLPSRPPLLDAAAEALPALRDVAASRDGSPVSCLAYGALSRAAGSAHPALREPAVTLLAKVKADCRQPSGDAGRAMPRGTPPLETAIERLDRVDPAEAPAVAAALVALGAAAIPPLQAHVRATGRCRGLALAAGILERLGAPAAGVEAAYVRLVEGECKGQEPFDLALAQSAADAAMRAPAGVTRMTALLPHEDVAVRRRAAQAFARAFERFGPGEHGAGAGGRDPALVPPMQAALGPLVTRAQTERDETARCQAVRALLHAQQAVHDALRAAAAAATAGRTLRCLAPPPR
jgi:hypothetical protein